MLDNPDLSRQWVLRRLQRALTLDLAAAAWQGGIATTAGATHRAGVRSLAEHAQQRTVVLRRLISELGSEPYSSIGLARAAARIGGLLTGIVGRWAWQPFVRQLAEHTLSEYDVLRAFVDGANGVEIDLQPHVAPLLASAQQGMETLANTA